MQENFHYRFRQALGLRVQRCAEGECRTDEECGRGCGCVLESMPMRCGPVDPEPEVCAGECRTDEDCGELCSCEPDRGAIQLKKNCLQFWLVKNHLSYGFRFPTQRKSDKNKMGTV